MSLLWPFHILLTDISCSHLCLFIFHWTKCWQIIPPTVSLLLTVFMNAAIPIAAVLTVSPTSLFLLISFSPSEVYVFIVCLVIFGGNHYWAKCVLWTFSPVWRTAEMRGQCPDFLWHGGELSVSAALNPSRIYRRPPRKVKQPPRRGTRINKKLNSSSWQPEECLVRVCWKCFTLIRADHQSHKHVFLWAEESNDSFIWPRAALSFFVFLRRRLWFTSTSRRTPICRQLWPLPPCPCFTSWSRPCSCSPAWCAPPSRLWLGEKLQQLSFEFGGYFGCCKRSHRGFSFLI